MENYIFKNISKSIIYSSLGVAMNLSFLHILYSAKLFPVAGTVQAVFLAAQKAGVNLTSKESFFPRRALGPTCREDHEKFKDQCPEVMHGPGWTWLHHSLWLGALKVWHKAWDI